MKRLLGGILLGIGILIAGVSGLCTVVAIGTSFVDPAGFDIVLMALMFGGIPFVFGALLIWGGRALMRP